MDTPKMGAHPMPTPCQALASALLDSSEATCRAAAYGLVASGPEAAQHVLRLLTLGRERLFTHRPPRKMALLYIFLRKSL